MRNLLTGRRCFRSRLSGDRRRGRARRAAAQGRSLGHEDGVRGRNVPPHVSHHCVDAETDKLMSASATLRQGHVLENGHAESRTTLTSSIPSARWAPSTNTTRSVIAGDFNSALYGQAVVGRPRAGRILAGARPDGKTEMTSRDALHRRLQGRSEARRHHHEQRHQDECCATCRRCRRWRRSNSSVFGLRHGRDARLSASPMRDTKLSVIAGTRPHDGVSLFQSVPREHLAHGLDQLVFFGTANCARPRLAPFLVARLWRLRPWRPRSDP